MSKGIRHSYMKALILKGYFFRWIPYFISIYDDTSGANLQSEFIVRVLTLA